jgi:hypothetical protein
MTDAHRRKVGAIIVSKFDRFARSVSHLLRALEKGGQKGRKGDFATRVDKNPDSASPVTSAGCGLVANRVRQNQVFMTQCGPQLAVLSAAATWWPSPLPVTIAMKPERGSDFLLAYTSAATPFATSSTQASSEDRSTNCAKFIRVVMKDKTVSTIGDQAATSAKRELWLAASIENPMVSESTRLPKIASRHRAITAIRKLLNRRLLKAQLFLFNGDDRARRRLGLQVDATLVDRTGQSIDKQYVRGFFPLERILV